MKAYICDPRKHKECRKTYCWYMGKGECYQTLKEEYSAKKSRRQVITELNRLEEEREEQGNDLGRSGRPN